MVQEAIGTSTYNEIYQWAKPRENQIMAIWMRKVFPAMTALVERNEERLKNTKPLDRESMAIHEQVAEHYYILLLMLIL